MELIVTDRASIEAGIVVHGLYVVISIHDPNKPHPKIRKTIGLVDVLYLAFHNAEPSPQFKLPAHIHLMTLATPARSGTSCNSTRTTSTPSSATASRV